MTEKSHREACLQHHDRCCNCGSTDYSLRWCPAPFQNIFHLNPKFDTHNPDGCVFEMWKRKCVTGVVRDLSADTKVTFDTSRLVTALHALTSLGSNLTIKVIVLGLRLPPVQQHLKHNLRSPRPLLPYHSPGPQVCFMVIYTQSILVPAPDNPVR